jgi:hypothetical protein
VGRCYDALEGPIARQNQYLFASDWESETGEDISILLKQVIPETLPAMPAQVIGTGPTVRYSAMPEMFETLMYAARRELVITTQYYVPDESMQAGSGGTGSGILPLPCLGLCCNCRCNSTLRRSPSLLSNIPQISPDMGEF